MALDAGDLCVVLNCFCFCVTLLCFAVLLFVFKFYPLSLPFCTRVPWQVRIQDFILEPSLALVLRFKAPACK